MNAVIKVLFIHHSTGANLIREGHVRTLLSEVDSTIEFWDHSYNISKTFPHIFAKLTYKTGLSDQHGHLTGYDYNIVLSNNSPKEYAEIFSRSLNDPTLRSILQYDIIAFKNCYPTTKIISDELLESDKKYYTEIIKSLGNYSNKKFILFSPPALRQELTKPEYTQRAINLIVWLRSQKFPKNVILFDFFGLLSNSSGVLKKEYTRRFPWDSHPNRHANEEIAPKFVQNIIELVK